MIDDEFATFSVRMPEALKARIEAIARQNYNSRNGMICLAVERLLEGLESPEKPTAEEPQHEPAAA